MMFSKILVAINGEAQSDKVLKLATKVAHESTLVHVVVVLAVEFSAPDIESKDASPASCNEQLRSEGIIEKAQRFLKVRNIECTAAVIPGDPERAISAYARNHGCDLIVMGHHHMSIFERLVGDSIAYEVLQNSPCPIMIEVG
jgi:nucleotide-binding universal stress UspA family protein